jgi:acyl carrier protein
MNTMENQEILSQLNVIFVDVLDNKNIQLTNETTAREIEEWDSLSHIQLIVAIEKHFKIKFTSMEIGGFKNVGDLVNTVQGKLSA